MYQYKHVFGPSVGNISKFVEDIKWLDVDEFCYTAIFLERHDGYLVKQASNRQSSLYIENNDSESFDKYQLDIDIDTIIFPLFYYGYLCCFDQATPLQCKQIKITPQWTHTKKSKKTGD